MSKKVTDLTYQVLLPFRGIRKMLVQQYMTASDVRKILKITKMQLLYWDEKGLKSSKGQVKDHAWRKFSILDVFGFGILKSLRELGVKLKHSERIFDWLRESVYEQPHFLHHFAEGDKIFLIVDIKMEKLVHYYGSNMQELNTRIEGIKNPIITTPVNIILKHILEKAHKQDFFVNFAKDRFGGNNRVRFFIYNEELYYDHGYVFDEDLTEEEIKDRICWEEINLIDSDIALKKLPSERLTPAERSKYNEKRRKQIMKRFKESDIDTER